MRSRGGTPCNYALKKSVEVNHIEYAANVVIQPATIWGPY